MMRPKRFITALLLLQPLASLTYAQQGQLKYIGANDGPWNVDDSWLDENTLQHRTPTSNDIARVPKNKSVKMTNETGSAYALIIEGPVLQTDTPGTLKIEQGCTLNLHGSGANTTLNGELQFVDASGTDDAPLLVIKNDHTILKTDNSLTARILGDVKSIIRGDDANDTLTLGDEEDDTARAAIMGDVDIEIELVNYGDVNATHPTRQNPKPRITLKTHVKSGHGSWKATKGELIVDVDVTGAGQWTAGTDGLIQINDNVTTPSQAGTGAYLQADYNGKLEVNAAVSGFADWKLGLTSASTAPEIEINAACTDLNGSFTMRRGLFDVNYASCTEGQASLYSDSSTYDSVIEVHYDAQDPVFVTFSGSCP